MLDSMFPIAVVVDTNFLVDRLNFIKDLARIMPSNMRICIPRVVIDELDGLKNKSSTQDRARMASNFVLESLISETRKFVGQRVEEMCHFRDNNDDQILDYCIYLKTNGTPNVILLSNDRNLCIKCHLEDIVPFPELHSGAQEFLELLGKGHGQSRSHTFHISPRDQQRVAQIEVTQPMDIDCDQEIPSLPLESYTLYNLLMELNNLIIASLLICLPKFNRNQSLNSSISTMEDLFQILISNKWGPPVDATMFRVVKDITRSIRTRKVLLTIGDIKSFIECIYQYLGIFDEVGLSQEKSKMTTELNLIYIKLDHVQ